MKNKKDDEKLKKIIQAKIRNLSKMTSKSLPSYRPSNNNVEKINPKQNKKIVKNDKIYRTKKVKRIKKIYINRWCGSIFLSGGIGDIFSIESFLTDFERQSLTTIYYATNKQKPIEELFRACPQFPNLKNHINVWNDFTNFWCFYSIEDYIIKTGKNSKINNEFQTIKDCSILKIFENIKNKKIQYNNSSFLIEKICDIKNFNLKEDYIVVSPYSTDKRLANRDFSQDDWKQTLLFCNTHNLRPVVINSGFDNIPKHESIINLSNLTNVKEAVEILKGAKGYVGIDSWLSVLAAKLFDQPFLQIKSVNKHCVDNAYCYFAPKTNFDFIVPKIKLL